MDQRLQALTFWLTKVLRHDCYELKAMEGDAGLRRYFRVLEKQTSSILMDLDLDKETFYPFTCIASSFLEQNIRVPKIKAMDAELGVVLMEDFGDLRYQEVLNSNNVNELYAEACTTLHTLQRIKAIPHYALPQFDAVVMEEQLQQFRSWFLDAFMQWSMTPAVEKNLRLIFDLLIKNATEQPYCLVHHDYHSRNLMQCTDGRLGVLDFQDAAMGPITYDLVSLLRDCYVDWPADDVVRWVTLFHQELKKKRQIDVSLDQFLHWFDWMGIQRHLKAIYIFARKSLRDKNDYYLTFIPRTLRYILDVSASYPDLAFLHQLVNAVIPKFEKLV